VKIAALLCMAGAEGAVDFRAELGDLVLLPPVLLLDHLHLVF
jgi:hypothetical protein